MSTMSTLVTDIDERLVRAFGSVRGTPAAGPVVSVLTHPGYDLAADYVQPDGGDWTTEFPIRGRADGRGVVNWTHGIPVGLGAVEHKAVEDTDLTTGTTAPVVVAVGSTEFYRTAADLEGVDRTEYATPSSRRPVGTYSIDECLRAAADSEALVRGGFATGVSIEFRPNGPKGTVPDAGAYWDREVKSPLLPRPARHFKSWTGLAYAHARKPVNPGCHTVLPDREVEVVAKCIRVMETGKVGGHALCERVLKSFREDAPDLAALVREYRRSTVTVEGAPPKAEPPTPAKEVKAQKSDAWVKWKIKKIMAEGIRGKKVSRKQAVAVAYSMAGREAKAYTGPLRAGMRLNPKTEDEDGGYDEEGDPDFDVPGLDEEDREGKAVMDRTRPGFRTTTSQLAETAHRLTGEARDLSRDVAAHSHVKNLAEAAHEASRTRDSGGAVAALSKLADWHRGQAARTTGEPQLQHQEAESAARRAMKLHSLVKDRGPSPGVNMQSAPAYVRPTRLPARQFHAESEHLDRAGDAVAATREAVGGDDAHRAARYAAMARQAVGVGDLERAGGAHLGAIRAHEAQLRTPMSDALRGRHLDAIAYHREAARKLHAELVSSGWTPPAKRREQAARARPGVRPGYAPYAPKPFSDRDRAALEAHRSNRLAGVTKSFEDPDVSDPNTLLTVARTATNLALRLDPGPAIGTHGREAKSYTDLTNFAAIDYKNFHEEAADAEGVGADAADRHLRAAEMWERVAKADNNPMLAAMYRGGSPRGSGNPLLESMYRKSSKTSGNGFESSDHVFEVHHPANGLLSVHNNVHEAHAAAYDAGHEAAVKMVARGPQHADYLKAFYAKARTDGFDVPAVALGPDDKPPASISALMNFAQLQMDGVEALNYDAQQSDDLTFRWYAKALAEQATSWAATLQKQAMAMRNHLMAAPSRSPPQHPLAPATPGLPGNGNQMRTTTSGDVPPGSDDAATGGDAETANGTQKSLDHLLFGAGVPAVPEMDDDGFVVIKAYPEWKPRRYSLSELKDVPAAKTSPAAPPAAKPLAPEVKATDPLGGLTAEQLNGFMSKLAPQLKKLEEVADAVSARRNRV